MIYDLSIDDLIRKSVELYQQAINTSNDEIELIGVSDASYHQGMSLAKGINIPHSDSQISEAEKLYMEVIDTSSNIMEAQGIADALYHLALGLILRVGASSIDQKMINRAKELYEEALATDYSETLETIGILDASYHLTLSIVNGLNIQNQNSKEGIRLYQEAVNTTNDSLEAIGVVDGIYHLNLALIENLVK